MKVRHPRTAPRRRGIALLAAILAALAAASVASLLMSYAATSARSAETKYRKAHADMLAEGAVEHARVQLGDFVTNGIAPPPTGSVVINDIEVEYTITQITPTAVVPDEDGLQTFSTRYELQGSASVSGFTSVSHRIVDTRAIPLFQFALFYENDLEFWPGPDMVLSGRVHSNGNIYLGSGNRLTVDTNYLRCAGDFYNHRKHSSEIASKTIDIRRWVKDPYSAASPKEFLPMLTQGDMNSLGVTTDSGFDSHFLGYDADNDGSLYGPGDWLPFHMGALERWSQPDFYMGGTGSTLKTGDMGVQRVAVPELDSLAMFEASPSGGDYSYHAATKTYVKVADGTGTHDKGPFHADAGLSVLTYPDGSWKAFDADGDDVSSALTGVISTTNLYDARQANGGTGNVDMAVIDMALLNDSGYFPVNGLLYFGAYGAGQGTKARGVQLSHGAKLLKPLTVVSENSVYIQGDYNTTERKPAAVLADAVNLLSNSWNNTKTATNGIPDASETTYNLSMVTGNIESMTGNYNGGVENLPRFHEDWKGIKCRIEGSITCLWYSKYATGNHSGISNLRNPPIRDWHFDKRLTNLANMPPFTPMSTSVDDVVTW